MGISENCLLISYDESRNKIIVRRAIQEVNLQTGTVLHTEYLLTKIKAMDLTTACRLLGEDILISLAGTRSLFDDTEVKKNNISDKKMKSKRRISKRKK
jgi:hypothetical protein